MTNLKPIPVDGRTCRRLGGASMDEEVIEHIRSRIERCRRLAALITDKQAIEILLQLADEGEADLRQLEAQAKNADEGPAAAT